MNNLTNLEFKGFGIFWLENKLNDVKLIICEKTWKSKYYIL